MRAAVLAVSLAGCTSSQLAAISPVDWWHGLEGGPIAATRPPPPDADAPYPSLGSVPAKPAPPDAATHARIAGALAADRANARYDAEQSPIGTVPPAAPRPPPPAPSSDSEQPNASMAAANAPPPPAAAPASPPAPRKAPGAPAAAFAAPPAPPAPAVEASMPSMPDAPPPAPRLAGVGVPSVTAPTLPPATPPAPPPPAPVAGAAVAIPFPAGSAVVPAAALPPIKLLARDRGAGSISVTGFGEAASSDLSAQSAALPLALDRARAVAASLLADGVPATAIRIGAAPQGSGAAATVVR